VSRLERYAGPGRLLDVGCGEGAFLRAARKRGWEVFGTELTAETARFARESGGLDVRTGGPAEWGFEAGTFDAVTFWHVLEHVPDPVAMLEQCARLLRPGGLIVVAVPNLRSLQAKLAGRHWFHLDVPYHVSHFSPASLDVALRRSGFDVLSTMHGCAEHGPYGVLQSLLNRMGIRPNAAFDGLKRGHVASRAEFRGNRRGLALSVLLLPLLVPLSVGFSLLETGLRRGGVVTVCARRRTR
jgi:SAM-dependent methyltransferase